ncbi:S41 family peptidase [Haliscomenobacter sp.]|uniref:S41 family peptidase n=1 Tax=Haliscomenobacter sp. TaxID=2717303 RepID=UPI003BA9CD7D
MKTHINLLVLYLSLLFLGCSKEFASPKDSNVEVFEEFLKFTEENYALLEVKKIDWEAVKIGYRPKVSNQMTQDSFFSICHQAIKELKDGQCYVNNGRTLQTYDFKTGYDIQFKLEVVLNYLKRKNIDVRSDPLSETINDTTAYVHFYSLFHSDSDKIKSAIGYTTFSRFKKVIIDLRNAYGGQPIAAFNLLRHFVSTPTQVGSMVHKNGRGPKDFKTVPVIVQPTSEYVGDKKIIILTNRYTFNVVTYVVAVLQTLPNVTLIGQTTGPGSGLELPYELPNGWTVAVASNYFLPANGRHIEDGIKPDIEINNTALDLQNKRDRMLERAIAE